MKLVSPTEAASLAHHSLISCIWVC